MVNPNGEESKPSMPAEPLCVSCKNLINPGATKCTHCGSYQRRWLSLLLLITGLSGFLAIVASSVSVLYTFLHDAYVLRDPVSVIHYSYKKGALFSNFSHSPIYIKSMFIVSSNRHFGFGDDFSVIVKPNDMIVYGNPLLVPPRSPNKKTPEEWLAALQGKADCLNILFSNGMPFYGTSGKVADASLYYVVGNGEVREKRIPLEERLIDCRDDSIWDIELEPRTKPNAG